MLIGHYAPALMLKRAAPTIPLWALFLATQLLDLFWGPFILLGVEHCRVIPGFTESNSLDLYDMPWSHSLAAAGVLSLVFGGLAALVQPQWASRGRLFLGAVIALAVFSHWLTDLAVHVADLPLAPGSMKVGFGLWRWRAVALAVETGFVLVGLLVVPRQPRSFILWAVMPTVCVISYVTPTPPTPQTTAVSGLAIYVTFALLAYAAERPPTSRVSSVPASR